MTGTGFVQAIFMWLLMLAFGAFITVAAVVSDATWLLVLMLGLMWVPLTMRWVWLAFRDPR